MNWMTKAIRAASAMLHPSRPGMFGWQLKRTRFDYAREVGDGLDASVVTAPVQFLQRALPEARLALRRRKRGGAIEDLDNHPMLELIQRPNAFYGDVALWAGTILSLATAGNAYWVKLRTGYGKPAELWYVPHWLITPKAPIDGSAPISHYEYRPGTGAGLAHYAVEDVVHFRLGIDPRDPAMGMSPIQGAVREIFADLESSNFVASLLRNMGVPGVVISPEGGAMPSPDDVAATKAWFQEAFGGDNRGAPLVMGAPTRVQPYGFNPQQMNMSEARDVAEERICACLGVPAAVVGFGAGLQSTKVGATMKELRQLAWHNGVLPLGRAIADELKRSLLPDFAGHGDPATLDLYWNTDDVPALQEDEDKRIERKLKELQAGAITLFDYLSETGRDADDSHRYYLRPAMSIEVPEGGRAALAGAPGAPALPVPEGAPGKAGWKAKFNRRASVEAMRRGEAFALAMQRQEAGLRKAMEQRLAPLFARIGKEVGAAVAGKLPGKSRQRGQVKSAEIEQLIAEVMELLDSAAWQAELTQEYGTHFLEVATAAQDAAEQAGLGTSLPDPVARAIVASGGRRAGLVDLDRQTREALFDALAEGRAEGLGAAALARRIEDYVEGGPWNSGEIRARIIARTETKYAQNLSTIERARAAGIDLFMVFDGRLGPGRSLESHMARHGSIVTGAEALAMADAEHPNGTLSFAPHFGDDDD